MNPAKPTYRRAPTAKRSSWIALTAVFAALVTLISNNPSLAQASPPKPAGGAASPAVGQTTGWPRTVEQAIPVILARLRPHQASIVRGTSRENLFLLLSEWGDDIEEVLGLERGNDILIKAVCPSGCKIEQATLKLMELAWEKLQRLDASGVTSSNDNQ